MVSRARPSRFLTFTRLELSFGNRRRLRSRSGCQRSDIILQITSASLYYRACWTTFKNKVTGLTQPGPNWESGGLSSSDATVLYGDNAGPRLGLGANAIGFLAVILLKALAQRVEATETDGEPSRGIYMSLFQRLALPAAPRDTVFDLFPQPPQKDGWNCVGPSTGTRRIHRRYANST
jgi:hypothetical protein